MKRKLFLITDFFPFGTGETFVMTELRHLSRWFDITVIPRYKAVGEPRPLPEGVKYKAVARSMSLREKVLFSLGFFFTRRSWREMLSILRSGKKPLKKILNSLKYHVSSELFWTELKENDFTSQSDGAVYYSFWYTAAAQALSAHRKELPGARIVVRTHGYDLYNERSKYGRQPFKPLADDGIDRVVSCCRYGKEYYLRAFHVADSAKYVYIPLGTNRERIGCTSFGKEALRLVSCSMAVPEKRIDRIIESLAVLDDVPVVWTHMGDGFLMKQLQSMAEEKLSGKKNITWQFTGNLSHDRVLAQYEAGAWDAFITTSFTEGSPISIQEALSYGVPVIATAVGGIPELLENTGNSLLSSNPAPEEVAAAIRRIWNLTPEQRNKLQNENRLHWEREYCAENNARRMMEMMEELWQ